MVSFGNSLKSVGFNLVAWLKFTLLMFLRAVLNASMDMGLHEEWGCSVVGGIDG